VFVTLQTAAALQSDAMFRVIEERVRAKSDLQHDANAVYLFVITVNGKNAAYWSKI